VRRYRPFEPFRIYDDISKRTPVLILRNPFPRRRPARFVSPTADHGSPLSSKEPIGEFRIVLTSGYGERAVFILKYFLFGGLSLLGVLFAVDSWIETPAQPETPSAATAALIAIARHGDRPLQPEFAIREERPVPKAAPDGPSLGLADQTVSGQPAPAATELKRVSDARAEMVTPERDAPKTAARRATTPRHAERRGKSKVASRNSYGRIRVVENATRRSSDPFELFGSW